MNDTSSHDFLQLSREEMQALGYQVVDILIEHFDTLQNKPVTRKMKRSILDQQLYEPLPEKGTSTQVVLQQLQQDVFCNIMHLDHPRFFAYVPSPNNFVSVMADALASGFNVFSGTWLLASGAAEIELVTIDWLRQLYGLPSTTRGLFVSGGTMANLTALAVARHIKLQDKIQNAVIYCSDQTHSSIEQGLRILGFESQQINKLPSDKNFRLRLPDLEYAVATDLAMGRIPFCVIANAGTTNTGAVDPLPELADFCSKKGLWLHVDGAYGATAVLCDKGFSLLKGLEHCDSLSLDPHKRLFQPYEAGCVLVRNGDCLKETFRIQPEYLKDLEPETEEINFCDYGIQLSRSFRALKLWMSLKVFGIIAFRKSVERGLTLAELAEQTLRESNCWEVVTPAQLGIITFRFLTDNNMSMTEIDTLNRKLVDKMIVDGLAMVSSTILRGRTVLRMCTINPRTTDVDIKQTIQRLEYFGNELSVQLEKQSLASIQGERI